MKEKKYTLKVLIGNKVVRIEKVSESLVSDLYLKPEKIL